MIADSNKEWKKADSFYETAVGLTTRPAGVMNNWGYSKLTRGDFATAERLFSDAIRQDDSLFTAKNNLILARGAQQKYSLPVMSMTQEERAQLLYTLGLSAIKQNAIQASARACCVTPSTPIRSISKKPCARLARLRADVRYWAKESKCKLTPFRPCCLRCSACRSAFSRSTCHEATSGSRMRPSGRFSPSSCHRSCHPAPVGCPMALCGYAIAFVYGDLDVDGPRKWAVAT